MKQSLLVATMDSSLQKLKSEEKINKLCMKKITKKVSLLKNKELGKEFKKFLRK